MQGVFVFGRRCQTKKELKEVAKGSPENIRLEATSLFGNEYDGTLDMAPNGIYSVVGPNPRTDRRWYATITVKDGKATVK